MVSKLERSAHKGVLDDLHTVANGPIGDIREFVRVYGKNIGIRGGASSLLAEFSPRGVKIGKSRLELPLQVTKTINDRSFSVQQILGGLNTNDISLNHVGVRYKVPALDEEVKKIAEFMKDDVYTVFEDPAGRPEGMRWLFIGLEDKNNSGKPRIDFPMFEIVLIDEKSDDLPHIQFDVDTLLTAGDIHKKVQKIMRLGDNEDPFSWHLDLEGIGRVVSMGVYNNEIGINHEVGIGTDVRSREAHRDSMVKISYNHLK